MNKAYENKESFEQPTKDTVEERITKINVRKRTDGSFIVDNNGYPFHLSTDYPCGEITVEKINEYIANGGTYEDYVDIIPEVPAEQKISILEQESLKYSSYILAGVDVDIYQQKLTNIIMEIEELKGNLNKI